ITACLMGSRVPAPAEERASLQSVAETICELGAPFPTSKLFELFELEVPFLILTEGPELLAAAASPCSNFRPDNTKSFYLVLGHRNKKGMATFFVTSLDGDLIQAS